MTIRGPFAVVIVVLLVVSLAANFIVLGFAAARYGARGGGDAPSIERIVALGARAFPREMRREINRALDGNRKELRAAARDLGAARREMFNLMAAEELDRKALRASFAEVRRKTDRLQQLGHELIEVVLEEAPPEARAKIRPHRRRR